MRTDFHSSVPGARRGILDLKWIQCDAAGLPSTRTNTPSGCSSTARWLREQNCVSKMSLHPCIRAASRSWTLSSASPPKAFWKSRSGRLPGRRAGRRRDRRFLSHPGRGPRTCLRYGRRTPDAGRHRPAQYAGRRDRQPARGAAGGSTFSLSPARSRFSEAAQRDGASDTVAHVASGLLDRRDFYLTCIANTERMPTEPARNPGRASCGRGRDRRRQRRDRAGTRRSAGALARAHRGRNANVRGNPRSRRLAYARLNER